MLGEGRAFGRAVQANALFRVADATIIALSVPEEISGCNADSLQSPWSPAWLGSADITTIVCDIGLFTPAEALLNECTE